MIMSIPTLIGQRAGWGRVDRMNPPTPLIGKIRRGTLRKRFLDSTMNPLARQAADLTPEIIRSHFIHGFL
jgi:hypothetical protein